MDILFVIYQRLIHIQNLLFSQKNNLTGDAFNLSIVMQLERMEL